MKHTKRLQWAVSALIMSACSIPALASSQAATAPFAEDQLVESIESIREHMRTFGVEHAPKAPSDTFRLTTYNIENLFDAHDDPALTGRDDDADETKPEHELVATALAIHAVNADVLCIQEVESEQALLEYRDKYLADLGYDHVVSIDAGNARGIENAVLSRFPITKSMNWPNMNLGGVHPELYGTKKNWYAGEPIEFRRSPLMVDLQIPGKTDAQNWTLTLFVMHHKSGHFNTYWREAEAKGTLKIINQVLAEHPERPIVILGDYNAQPDENSVQVFLENGFVDIFHERSMSDEIVTHESGRRIDLILANQPALERMRTDDAFVYGTTARPQGTTYRDLETFEGYAADHYPVSVDIAK